MGDMTAADRQLIARRLLAVIAIGLIIFTIIWFIFIRDTAPRVAAPVSRTGQSQQSSPSVETNNTNTGNPTAATTPPGTQNTATSVTPSSPNQPNQLAAAGPGDILALFGSTVIVGTGLHHAFKHRPKELF